MLLPMLNVLYFYCRTLRSACEKSNMDVFCSSLVSRFLIMLLQYGVIYFKLFYYYWYHICFTFHMLQGLYISDSSDLLLGQIHIIVIIIIIIIIIINNNIIIINCIFLLTL